LGDKGIDLAAFRDIFLEKFQARRHIEKQVLNTDNGANWRPNWFRLAGAPCFYTQTCASGRILGAGNDRHLRYRTDRR